MVTDERPPEVEEQSEEDAIQESQGVTPEELDAQDDEAEPSQA